MRPDAKTTDVGYIVDSETKRGLRKRNRNTRSDRISFDSFIFMDSITNNKIVMKDAKKEYF